MGGRTSLYSARCSSYKKLYRVCRDYLFLYDCELYPFHERYVSHTAFWFEHRNPVSGPLAFRWTFQFYDQSQTSAELADLLERVSPYFLNGVQVFGVIIVEAIVFLALIAFVYRRQEI